MKDLFRIYDIQDKYNINNNLMKILIHLDKCEIDSFIEMKEKKVVDYRYKSLRDIQINSSEFVISQKVGCSKYRMKAEMKLTRYAKEIMTLLKQRKSKSIDLINN